MVSRVIRALTGHKASRAIRVMMGFKVDKADREIKVSRVMMEFKA
jgi:hypothetical protein